MDFIDIYYDNNTDTYSVISKTPEDYLYSDITANHPGDTEDDLPF